MASAFAGLESSGFLFMGTAKDPCVCSPVDNREALHVTVYTCQIKTAFHVI
jgi:hypothetical protein